VTPSLPEALTLRLTGARSARASPQDPVARWPVGRRHRLSAPRPDTPCCLQGPNSPRLPGTDIGQAQGRVRSRAGMPAGGRRRGKWKRRRPETEATGNRWDRKQVGGAWNREAGTGGWNRGDGKPSSPETAGSIARGPASGDRAGPGERSHGAGARELRPPGRPQGAGERWPKSFSQILVEWQPQTLPLTVLC